MLRALEGEVAIVTGGSSGIGAAAALELARRGARVVLAARRAGDLDAQARAIAAASGQAIAVPTDMTDPAQVERLVARARQAFGHVDALVNCAGASWKKPVAATSAEDIVQLVKVNLLGAMLLTRAALPEMLRRRHGAIISVGSVQSRVAVEPLYSATKFGVRGFSLALRRQLAHSGVSVSLVTPGNIRTAMTRDLQEDMPGPEIVAQTIAGLVLAPRREVIVPVSYRAIVWLDQLAPGLSDWVYQWRHRHDEQARSWDEANEYVGSEGPLLSTPIQTPQI
ncbi:MAG TPA: SDR family oxidoreductase [Ktedonobacterales bacterium]